MTYSSTFKLIFIISFTLLSFISCEPSTGKSSQKTSNKPSEQIDQVADEAGELIDVFSKKAKEFLEGDEMEEIKDIVDDFSNKANEIVKDSAKWKAKLEELKNDKELKELLENYKSDGEEVLSKLEKLLNDLGENADTKKQN